MKQIAIILLSFFYTGYFPKMPGTFGSLVSLCALYMLYVSINIFSVFAISLFLVILFIFTYILSYLSILYYVDKDNCDQQWIVIDEFLGMLITISPLFFFKENIFLFGVIGFMFFRFFDILKPFGIKIIDNKHSASSVLLDDVLAGIYACGCLLIVHFLFY